MSDDISDMMKTGLHKDSGWLRKMLNHLCLVSSLGEHPNPGSAS